MDRHCDNAERVVEFLGRPPAVCSRSIYPGLAGPPRPRGRRAADEAVRRHGVVPGHRRRGAARSHVCDRAEVFTLGESLGGVESLIEHPGRMTHASVAGTELEVPGRPDPAQRRHRDRRRPARRPRPVPLADRRRRSASTSARRSPRPRWSTWPTARIVARRRAPRPRSTPTSSTGTTRAWPSSSAPDPRAAEAEVLACSSAGGGLRIAVVGNEELVTAEAGRRVALSSGGKVVARRDAAAAGPRPRPAPRDAPGRRAADRRHRRRQRRGAARAPRAPWSAGGWRGPVVVAGNVDARDEVAAILAGVPARPRRQRRAPDRGARARSRPGRAIREMFLSHVIGGKHLEPARPTSPRWSAAPRRTSCSPASSCWPGTTPARVERRGRRRRRRHHRRPLGRRARPGGRQGWPARWSRPPRSPAPSRATSACAGRRSRTVDEAGLPDLRERPRGERRDDPGFLPGTDAGARRGRGDRPGRGRRSRCAGTPAGPRVVVSPEGRVVERSGKDLREVDLLVGSGGVLRHGRAGVADRVLGPAAWAATEGGWQLPERARVVVDTDYVLAAAGCWPPSTPTRRTGCARPVCWIALTT